MATNKFEVKPQRQIRKVTEEAERAPEGGQPTEPQLTPQRKGGALLDFDRYDPATQLLEQQKLDTIRDFTEAGKTTIDATVKRESKQKEAQGKRLFDKIAQYQIDTRTVGRAAKDLRKAGQFELANEILDKNPWLFFGLKTQEASFAGNEAAMHVSNWVDANINDLQLIEDPTTVRKQVSNEFSKFIADNYPDISNENYTGLVEPVIAKTTPVILKTINNAHITWRGNARDLKTMTGLTQVEKSFLNSVNQDSTNDNRNAGIDKSAKEQILAIRDTFLAEGGTGQEWQIIAGKWVKGMFIDENNDGVNDLQDKELFARVQEALTFQVPGMPKGMTFLDLPGPEGDGKTIGDLLAIARFNAAVANNKKENMEEQVANREASYFKRTYRRSLHLYLDGKTGPEAELVKTTLLQALDNAQENGGPVFLKILDEKGDIQTVAFDLPTNTNVDELKKMINKGGAELPESEFRIIEQTAIRRLLNNSGDPLLDIFEQLVPGTAQYADIAKLQNAAFKLKLKDNYSAKISGSVQKITEVLSTSHRDARRAYENANPTYDKKQIKRDFKDLLDANKGLVEERWRDYIAAEILTAPEGQVYDEEWWREKINDFTDIIKSEPLFMEPNIEDIYGEENVNREISHLYTGSKGEGGDISPDNNTRLLDNDTFLRRNKYLLDTNEIKNYYKNNAMMSSKTFSNVYSFLATGAELDDEALVDLAQGYSLAKKLSKNKDLTILEFLNGQGSKNVFYWTNPKKSKKEPYTLFVPEDEARINELTRRLSVNVVGPTSTIRIADTVVSNEDNGSINFWVEDNSSGNMNVNISVPVFSTVKEIGYAEGTDGNFIKLQVNKEGASGDLKEGYIIVIRHARSFGGLAIGQELYPGNYLALQHNKKTFTIGKDQADVPGAGPHLNLYITDSAGNRLSQEKVSKIFKEVLSPHLAI